MYVGAYVKYPVFLPNFNEPRIFLIVFQKYPNIKLIKIHPVGSKSFHADRQMVLTFVFDNYANAPNTNRGSLFVNATNTATLMHRKSVSARHLKTDAVFRTVIK